MEEDNKESMPLLKNTDESRMDLNAFLKSGAKKFSYVVVAIPTSLLSALSVLCHPDEFNELHSPGDMYKLINKKGAGTIVYATIAFLGSEVVLFYLNRRYLLGSGKAVWDLIKRTINSTINGCELKEGAMLAGENVLFFWSLITSLIFAEMGGKALTFLGTPGEVSGFSLSLVVYFATRFASADMGFKIFFGDALDENSQLKKKYLDKLDVLRLNKIPTEYSVDIQSGSEDDDVNSALVEFLNRIDTHWHTLPKDHKRQFLSKYLAPTLGGILVLVTALPIASIFIPLSAQGAETLFHTDIGADSHYQNVSSITFGAFATALTLFFYELNIKDLPKHFLKTACNMYEKIKEGDISTAMKLLAFTTMALGTSCCVGLGFKFVAELAISNGYLSYLGGYLSSLIPDGLLMAVTTMLWSHLQDLINQPQSSELISGKDAIETIDPSNVTALLMSPKTNITELGLLGNNTSSFFGDQQLMNSQDVKIQVSDSGEISTDEITSIP